MEEPRSGSFLTDVDIEVIIRSGKTDLMDLTKLAKAISASLTDLVDTEIVLTEEEIKVNTTSERRLSIIKSSYQI